MNLTLKDALAGGNALNFVRLALAGMVLLVHSWTLGGYAGAPTLGEIGYGHLAVAGFFAISGYLITASRMRLPLGRFLWNRAMRILPGFWVCLVFVAFVLAPIVSAVAGWNWSPWEALGYVWHNAALVITQDNIGSTPAGVALPGMWNGSLWTLVFEFLAYLCTATLFSLPLARHRPAIVSSTMLAVFLAAQFVTPALGVTSNSILHAMWLGTFYSAGSLLWALSSRIVVSPLAIGIALAVFAVAVLTDSIKTLGAIPFAFIVLALGAVLPVRLGTERDISYGVYIYAFPLQQALAALGVQTAMGVEGFAAMSVGVTLPLAWLSWQFVERPAKGFKLSRFAVRKLQARHLSGI